MKHSYKSEQTFKIKSTNNVIFSSFRRNDGPRTGSMGGGFTAKMHIKYSLKAVKTFSHNL